MTQLLNAFFSINMKLQLLENSFAKKNFKTILLNTGQILNGSDFVFFICVTNLVCELQQLCDLCDILLKLRLIKIVNNAGTKKFKSRLSQKCCSPGMQVTKNYSVTRVWVNSWWKTEKSQNFPIIKNWEHCSRSYN